MIAALYVQPNGATSRAEAIALGSSRYFTGKACKHGHVAERYVASWSCVECVTERGARYAIENPQERAASYRAYRQANAGKIAAQKKAWKAANRDKHRASNRKWKLKRLVSIETYEEMLSSQGGRCAICGTSKGSATGKDNRRLAVDHCHSTMVVRGLLCGNCNRMLGLIKDSPAVLRRAAAYLEAAR